MNVCSEARKKRARGQTQRQKVNGKRKTLVGVQTEMLTRLSSTEHTKE